MPDPESEYYEAALFYADQADRSKIKRARNRERGAHMLHERGVKFESKNAGAHLIVQTKSGVVDYWPGTGKFIPRPAGKSGRGIFNLLRLC